MQHYTGLCFDCSSSFLDCSTSFFDCSASFLDCSTSFFDCSASFLDCSTSFFDFSSSSFSRLISSWKASVSLCRKMLLAATSPAASLAFFSELAAFFLGSCLTCLATTKLLFNGVYSSG